MRITTPSSPPERLHGGVRWATLPNLLSALRALALVPVLWLLDRPGTASDAWAIVLLVVAGLSDLLDGFLARHRGAVSPTGKIVDPVADKILIVGLVLYLSAERGFPLWLVGLVIARDALLLAGGLFLFARERLVFAANWSGKLATFVLGLTILAYLLRWRAAYGPLTTLAAAAVAVSFVAYGWRAWTFRGEA